MFKNEVIVSEADKNDMLFHIKKINEILDKYPYFSSFDYTVTNISRAKSLSKEAEKWIGYLCTSKDEK